MAGHSPAHSVMVGRKARAFERFSGWALGWLYRAVARRVVAELPPDGDVLDIGTGPGRLLTELAQQRPDVRAVGIDPSVDMIGYAIARATVAGLRSRVEPLVATAESLPFPNQSFDAVVSTLSSHHWADPAAAVAEQLRVLRPGGRLWIVDLRRVVPAAALDGALAREAPSVQDRKGRLGGLAGLVFVCYEVTRLP